MLCSEGLNDGSNRVNVPLSVGFPTETYLVVPLSFCHTVTRINDR